MKYIFTQTRWCLFVIFALSLTCSLLLKGQEINRPVAELIGSGFTFTEGPLWLDGQGLIFSDVRADTIFRLDSLTNARSTFFRPSGNSNGLALDTGGNIVIAQHGTRAISRLVNGQLVPIATTFRGRRLNSPNDLVVKSDGSIFFTDPPYGITAAQREQTFNGVYRIGRRGVIYLLDSTFTSPNGLAFSPNESLLYVNETQTRTIYVFDVINDSVLSRKRVFFQFRTSEMRGADGMKVDSAGSVYSTAPTGIYIISPAGRLIDSIAVPGSCTNVAFGNADRKTLYITAGPNVYRARNAVITGVANDVKHVATSPITLTGFDNLAQLISMEVNVNYSNNMNLEVRNLSGQSVGTLFNGKITQGLHHFDWNYGQAPAGMYLLYLSLGGQSYIQKTVVVK